MKYIFQSKFMLALVTSMFIGFASESNAQINLIWTQCSAASSQFSTTNYWSNKCHMLVDEQELAVASDGLKMFFTILGSVYMGGNYVGTPTASDWYVGYITPSASQYTPGYYVHYGLVEAEGYATKYADIPTNTVGITWQTMCALASFHAKPVGGAYAHHSEYDTNDCIPSPITTE